MAPRRLLQLGAVVAAASCLLAASFRADSVPVPLPPSRGVPATAVVAPAPAAFPNDVTAVVFRGARRLGPRPPHRLRLSADIPADGAPAAAPSDDYAAAGHFDYDSLILLLVIFSPVLIFLGWLFLVGLQQSAVRAASLVAERYAAAMAARAKARRVHPVVQDDEAAAGP